nr:hypothetical protein [Clostridioides sp.]
MINENSPTADIALEAKDTSNDVKQIAMGIEAYCKHVDNTVTTMPLSGVSEFIDNFPTGKPTITPGYIGYANDKNGGKYDITSIEKVFNVKSPVMSPDGTISTVSTVSDLFATKDGKIITFNPNDILRLHDAKTGAVEKQLALTSGKNFANLIEANGVEYLVLYEVNYKFYVYNTSLSIVKNFDPIPNSQTLRDISYYDGSLVVTSFDGVKVYFNLYNFETTDAEVNFSESGSNIYPVVFGEYIYTVSNNLVKKYNRSDSTYVTSYSQPLSSTIRSVRGFGNGKILISNSNSSSVVFDTTTGTSSSVISTSNSSYHRSISDGDTAILLVGSQILRINEKANIIYSFNSNDTMNRSTYFYPLFCTLYNTNIRKYNDNTEVKLIAKAQKRD